MKRFILLVTIFYLLNPSKTFAQSCLWAKSEGGNKYDYSNSVTTDASGNVYITGSFASPTISFGSTTLTNSAIGYYDVFIVKYDAAGSVIWAKSAGGSDYDYSQSVTTDSLGNVYITGSFASPNITFGTTTLTNAGYGNVFLVKYDSAGSVVWAKSAGGNRDDESRSVTTDATGNIYITGYFSSPTITLGTTTITNVGGNDIFIMKFDSDGNVLWAKSAGGINDEQGQFLASDALGNVYISGFFASPTINFGTTMLSNSGTDNIFLVKFDKNGSVLWAKSVVGNGDDVAQYVTTDILGNVYITGSFSSPTLNFGTTTLTNTSFYDLFLAKYDASGTLIWAKNPIGSSNNFANAVTTDNSGNVLITGFFAGATFTFDTTTLTSVGGSDIFLAKYNSSGDFIWAKGMGGGSNDFATSVITDASKNIYITGYFESPNITFGATTLTNVADSSSDIFLAKYSSTTSISTIISGSGNISIYPNPTTNAINLTIDNPEDISTVQVYDMMGREVFHDGNLEPKNIANNSINIMLPYLPNGVYTLRAIGSKGTVQKRFEVKH